MRALNLVLKFLLELAAVALLAYWGAEVGDGAWAVVLAVAAPLAMIVVWGRWAAPRAPHRLPPPARIPLELTVFALAALGAAAAGAAVPALVFAAATAVNAALLTAWDQWSG